MCTDKSFFLGQKLQIKGCKWRSLQITKTDRLDVTDRVGSQIHTLKSWCVIFLQYREISGEKGVTHESLSQWCLCSSVPPGTAHRLELRAGLGRTSWIYYSEQIIQAINDVFLMTVT